MAKRKSLSKSERYEVLKRDSFTCQYCGKSAPEVILEVDHIVPVAEGGTNDLINLITSCRDCNRGKGKRKLSDSTVIDKQKEQMKRQNELREQTEMMIQWRKELLDMEEKWVDSIEELLRAIGGMDDDRSLSKQGRLKIKGYIKRFGFDEVYTAIEIAVFKYSHDTDYQFSWMLDKVGGICYNRQRNREQKNGN